MRRQSSQVAFNEPVTIKHSLKYPSIKQCNYAI